jgi:hypothetical protein
MARCSSFSEVGAVANQQVTGRSRGIFQSSVTDFSATSALSCSVSRYGSGFGTITRASAPVARMAANAVSYSFGLSTRIEEELKISSSAPSAQLNP